MPKAIKYNYQGISTNITILILKLFYKPNLFLRNYIQLLFKN